MDHEQDRLFWHNQCRTVSLRLTPPPVAPPLRPSGEPTGYSTLALIQLIYNHPDQAVVLLNHFGMTPCSDVVYGDKWTPHQVLVDGIKIFNKYRPEVRAPGATAAPPPPPGVPPGLLRMLSARRRPRAALSMPRAASGRNPAPSADLPIYACCVALWKQLPCVSCAHVYILLPGGGALLYE